MSTQVDDLTLRRLLGRLMWLIQRKGSQSPDVLDFIREHREVEEFPELAATCLLAVEEHSDMFFG